MQEHSHANERLAWFNQAKVGLFVHWGPYALAGVEASWPIMFPEAVPALFGPQPRISESDYLALAQQFNPQAFDAKEWTRVATSAGMRYMVFTTKHHDGYCMFDAPDTAYKVTATPFGRDVTAELAQACQQAKLPLGLYYSPVDLHHAGYRDTSKRAVVNWLGQPEQPQWSEYLDYMEAHLQKLLQDYGPVALVWFDGLFAHDRFDPPRMHQLVHTLCPDALINDRLGPTLGDYVTPEQFVPAGIPIRRQTAPQPPAQPRRMERALMWSIRFGLVRRLIARGIKKTLQGGSALGIVPTEPLPAAERFQPWETCMTLNRTWGYNPHDRAWKSPAMLIRTLVEVVSRGGNFLLNVGPDADGTIPPEAVTRLEAVGQWLATNGEAVYGTTYGPLQELDFARTTAKGEYIYLLVMHWPKDGHIQISGLSSRIDMVHKVADGQFLPFKQRDDTLEIHGPRKAPDPVVTAIKLHIR